MMLRCRGCTGSLRVLRRLSVVVFHPFRGTHEEILFVLVSRGGGLFVWFVRDGFAEASFASGGRKRRMIATMGARGRERHDHPG